MESHRKTIIEDGVSGPTGYLEVWKTGPDGQTTLAQEASGPNLVVNLARVILSRLVGGAAPDSFGQFGSIPTQTLGPGGTPLAVPIVSGIPELAIAKMQWGTSPAVPSPGQEALLAPLPLQKGVTVEYPSGTQVTFTSVLDNGDLNGEDLAEAVLLTHSNLVFARKTFTAPETKAYAFVWTFRWTINF